MRIVIIEDFCLLRDLFYRLCSLELGHDIVATASSGEEAVEAVMRTRPDLLLLDINLPDMDGFEVLSRIRCAAFPFPNVAPSIPPIFHYIIDGHVAHLTLRDGAGKVIGYMRIYREKTDFFSRTGKFVAREIGDHATYLVSGKLAARDRQGMRVLGQSLRP
jgi:chemotaxis response regulator CheB